MWAVIKTLGDMSLRGYMRKLTFRVQFNAQSVSSVMRLYLQDALRL